MQATLKQEHLFRAQESPTCIRSNSNDNTLVNNPMLSGTVISIGGDEGHFAGDATGTVGSADLKGQSRNAAMIKHFTELNKA